MCNYVYYIGNGSETGRIGINRKEYIYGKSY